MTVWTPITEGDSGWSFVGIEAFLATTDGTILQTTDGLSLVILTGSDWGDVSETPTTWTPL